MMHHKNLQQIKDKTKGKSAKISSGMYFYKLECHKTNCSLEKMWDEVVKKEIFLSCTGGL